MGNLYCNADKNTTSKLNQIRNNLITKPSLDLKVDSS